MCGPRGQSLSPTVALESRLPGSFHSYFLPPRYGIMDLDPWRCIALKHSTHLMTILAWQFQQPTFFVVALLPEYSHHLSLEQIRKGTANLSTREVQSRALGCSQLFLLTVSHTIMNSRLLYSFCWCFGLVYIVRLSRCADAAFTKSCSRVGYTYASFVQMSHQL